MEHRRKRYQSGSLTIEQREKGPDVWVYRWRDATPTGVKVRRKRIIGTKEQLPNKTAALRAVDALRMDINATASVSPTREITVSELASHYREHELKAERGKSQRTCDVYLHQIEKVILPRWGKFSLGEVKAIAIERWLEELPQAAGTKAKTKCVFSVLYQHAMRYEWATSNPVRLARQSSMPRAEQIVLTPEEVCALLNELRDPFEVIVLTAAVTGLRRGELFGLQWRDIDFAAETITISRSLVDMVEGPPKTLASRRPLPMARELAVSLCSWKAQSEFVKPDDWVFASPHALGKKPYWPDAVLKRHVLPAAKRAGITKRIGWHSFRRTLATLLFSSGANIKVAQDLMRHATSQMTLEIYAKAVQADKREAQSQIAALFVKPEQEAA